MKLDDSQRALFFNKAISCNALLGSPFQNPHELSIEDIERELKFTVQMKNEKDKMFDSYISLLKTLIC